MKLTSLKALPVLLGAIAFFAAPLSHKTQAEAYNCPDYFDDMSLSDQQLSEIEAIESQFDETLESILPLSPETEDQITALEDAFEAEVETLFSVQQQRRLAQIDQWAEEQAIAIAPELFDAGDFEETDEDLDLTPQQETALEAVEEEYDSRIKAILTPEQAAQIETLEKQLEEDIDTILPEPSETQRASIEAAESDLETRVMQLLTAEQQQQLESNVACYENE